ncbi:MAG TPA: hypothetical protein VIB38_08265 [Aestuariivirgaceae bacterium]|jgi:hypothetical protein
MSDPNSNTAEAGANVVDGAASGNGENQNPQSPSGEGSAPETGAPPPENGESDVPDVLAAEALIEITVASTAQSMDDNDLHGAVVSTTDAAMLNVDYTLDQLINSSDLFDVPALDFSDDLPT